MANAPSSTTREYTSVLRRCSSLTSTRLPHPRGSKTHLTNYVRRILANNSKRLCDTVSRTKTLHKALSWTHFLDLPLFLQGTRHSSFPAFAASTVRESCTTLGPVTPSRTSRCISTTASTGKMSTSETVNQAHKWVLQRMVFFLATPCKDQQERGHASPLERACHAFCTNRLSSSETRLYHLLGSTGLAELGAGTAFFS